MPQYYRNSSLTWPQYLKAQAFVDDVKDGIRSAGKAMSSKIDEQTDDIIASNEALGESISSGLDQLDSALKLGFERANETLSNGFDRMEYGLDKIAGGIAGLRSDFNWAMSGLLHKLDMQNLLLRDIYVELRIPDFQKERRYYVEQGCKHYTNGLYQESLECFLKAEPLEKTDPFALYSIGQIYLYQSDMIDLEKAQDYFTRAGKYYVAEKKNKQAGESYFHAGIAAYLRRDDVNAPQFAQKASELYPELLEAFYNHAKFLAIQGNDSGLMSLESAIRKDKNYASKVLADKDFSRISGQVKALLERLKEEARTNAESSIVCTEKLMDEYVIFDDHIKNEIKNEIHDLLCYFKTLLAKDCYFDYLECINESRKMHDKLEEMRTNLTIKEIKNLTGSFFERSFDCISPRRVCDLAFSPDGLTLAIMLEDKIKLWQVHTGKEIKSLNCDGLLIGMSISANDSIHAITSGLNIMKLWNIITGKEIVTFEVQFEEEYSQMRNKCAFSSNGHTMAIFSYTGTVVELRETKTCRIINTLRMHTERVITLGFSPDGMILAGSMAMGINSKSYKLQLWDAQTGREIKTLSEYKNTELICLIVFSPDSTILAIGLFNGAVELWDMKTYRQIKVLSGYSPLDNARSLAFSPDGRMLAIGYSGRVKLWDLHLGREIKTLNVQQYLGSIAFSPDGLILAIGSSNNLQCWLLTSKVMSKLQSERLKHYENAVRINKQQQEDDDEKTIKMQQKKWRSEGRCEVCGENLGFRLIPRTRCKKHQ